MRGILVGGTIIPPVSPTVLLQDLPVGALINLPETSTTASYRKLKSTSSNDNVIVVWLERVFSAGQSSFKVTSDTTTWYENSTIDVMLTDSYFTDLDQRVKDAAHPAEIICEVNNDWRVLSRAIFILGGTELGYVGSGRFDGQIITGIYTSANASRQKYISGTTLASYWTRSTATSPINAYSIGNNGAANSTVVTTTRHFFPVLSLRGSTLINNTPEPDGSYNMWEGL